MMSQIVEEKGIDNINIKINASKNVCMLCGMITSVGNEYHILGDGIMLGMYLSLIDEPHEQEAFTRLYLKYRKLMHYAARKILRNDMLAEEAVQEAFIRIAKNFSKVGEIDSPSTKRFVVVIAENAAKTVWNKEYKTKEVSLDADINQRYTFISDNVTDENFERGNIVNEILELPKMQRDTLYFYALYGYSYKEVANLLGISEAAARKNVERGRKALTDKLQSYK